MSGGSVVEDDDDDECFFVPDLFLNEDYDVVTYEIGDVSQRVLCLQSASTDHDLTGQVVWPVSVLLAWFVASRRERLRGSRVLEVGAGCGLSGLVAATCGAARVALTDGSDVVVRLLEQGVDRLELENVLVHNLLWGDRPSFDAFNAADPDPYDYVIGADVVCWPKLVVPLLETVLALLRRSPREDAAFICGFVSRAESTKDLFFEEATRRGFDVREHDIASFLPDPRPDNVKSALTLRLIELTLTKAARDAPDVFSSDDPDEASQYGMIAC